MQELPMSHGKKKKAAKNSVYRYLIAFRNNNNAIYRNKVKQKLVLT